MPNNLPTDSAYEVVIDGLTLQVPSDDRCWDFKIVHACGHPVFTESAGMVCRKIIRVKRHNHKGSCSLRRCIRGSQTHFLSEQCIRCEIVDNRLAGVNIR
ncbi:hypothetical protein F4680DRAFT_421175 [Xylaria scruposa]|nr:hypothetical protein F4680DRAFT_421175 [Xylaria scruposa]